MLQRHNFLPRSDYVSKSLITAGPIVVPADFLGIHSHRWPLGTAPDYTISPAPTYLSYKNYRTHDGGVFWRECNPSSNTYDWTRLDAIITAHRSVGATVTYTLHGTPEWAATTEGKLHNDPYGAPGGSDRPESLSSLETFTQELVTRYNAVGGTWRVANPTLGKGIAYLECWNEPEFKAVGQETYASNRFFWRSAEAMVDMCKTIRTAAKAIDADILILSPGFTLWSGSISLEALPFLTGTGTVTGVTGASAIDGFGVHPYTHDYISIVENPSNGIIACKAVLATAGIPNMPIYHNEYGVDSWESPALATFLALPATYRRARIARTAVMSAIYGIKAFTCYGYDHSMKLWGDSLTDTNGVIAGFNDASIVCGKTLTNAYYLSDGRISVTVDGTERIF